MSALKHMFEMVFSPAFRRACHRSQEAGVHHYVHDLQALPRLSAQEEALLVRRAAATDQEARCRLVEAHLGLVLLLAWYFQGRGLPLSELIQEGNLGLIEAIKRFDTSRACRLTTYARYWIAKYMLQALRERTRLITLPARAAEHIERIERVLAQDRARGSDPTIPEIARATGLSAEQVVALLDVMHDPLHLSTHPQEEPLVEHLEAPPLVLQQDDDAPALTPAISEAIAQLSTHEQQVLMLRFGLQDGVAYDDYHEIAQLVFNRRGKRVDERVRQIEKSAMKKLRVLLQASQQS